MLSNTEQIEISDFLVNIKPLLKQRMKPIRVLKKAELDFYGFYPKFNEVLKELGMDDDIVFIKTKPNDFDLYEEIVNRCCDDYLVRLVDLDEDSLKASLMNYGHHSNHLVDRLEKHHVTSFDGTELNVFSYGHVQNDPIVIVLPTGLPVQIMKPWIEILAQNFFVVTWETRGMSRSTANNNLNIEGQLDDLEQIIEFFDLDVVHLFGVCHGANLALHACHKLEYKVVSASLWHGDFNWKDDSKLTYTQQNMKRLLEMANHTDDISGLRSLMSNPKSLSALLENYPMKMLPMIMYPYVTDQIFSNFLELTRDILYRDLKEIATQVKQRVFVVTSAEDNTAHSAGSGLMHSHLENSEFHDRQEGSHMSFFEAPRELQVIFSEFYESNFAHCLA